RPRGASARKAGGAAAAAWGLMLTALALTCAWGARAGLAGWFQAVPVMEFRGSLVFIDPGHGGKDPGAVGPGGVREKDVVLAVAARLEALLNRAGIYTALSRRDDTDLA